MDAVDFEEPYPCNVSEEAKTEQREFLYESIALLTLCEKRKMQSDTIDDNEEIVEQRILGDHKLASSHRILHGFLSLLLVRQSQRDVAAAAIYITRDKVTVYWTKNEVDDDDLRHAEQVKSLVTKTAHDRSITLKEFYDRYFDIVITGCHDKFIQRWETLRNYLRLKSIVDEVSLSAASGLLVTLDALAKYRRNIYTVRCNADREAASYSSSNNVYDGLANALQELINFAKGDDRTYGRAQFIRIAAYICICRRPQQLQRPPQYQCTSTSTISPCDAES